MFRDQSPSKQIKKHLTTPRSPQLSSKKRCEFAEKTKILKTTEELQLEEMNNSAFKARPVPTRLFSAWKEPVKLPSTEKKLNF